jgi:multifunctional methyltransferase subunit TRM112
MRQVGDTSLPLEQPEMTDDDFLQKLHHVLLEVPYPISLPICVVIAYRVTHDT